MTMIIKEALVDPLNAQILSEFTAHAQYIAIAVYFEDETLPELADFFYRQAAEEKEHAMMFIKFMLDTGIKPTIPATPTPQNEFADASAAVQLALDQELLVTDQINNLVMLSNEHKDNTCHQFLQWFVTEQVEEVSSMTDLLDTIKHSGGNLLWVEDYVRRRVSAESG